MREKFDVVILGAGAAGLMCAMEAGRRGRRVLVVDHAERIGKKILISGGGRCNFTNTHCRPENFLSSNPHFAKSALARYTPQDFIALVEKHRIPYHEKTLGQLFCDRTAHDILNMLEDECRRSKVTIRTGVHVREIKKPERFELATENGTISAEAVVVATGGLSIPKMGASGFGYDVAKQFGLRVLECRPALVPLTFSAEQKEQWCDLTGVAVDVAASVGKTVFREKMLITHKGLSGPAILQISSYWRMGQELKVDVAPGKAVLEPLLADGSRRDLNAVKNSLRSALPNRFAERWSERYKPTRWTNAALEEYEAKLHDWRVTPAGTEGFDKAEVTAGGVSTDELSAKTMEAKAVPGLYFIGEVVDVTGHLGGFNFQWAWASGVVAGQAV